MPPSFSPQLQHILDEFDQPGSLAQQNMIFALQQAPLLLQQLELAVARGEVQHTSSRPRSTLFKLIQLANITKNSYSL